MYEGFNICNVDENNCHRHDVPCEYDRLAENVVTANTPPIILSASRSPSTGADSPSSPAKNPTLQFGLWEMRALHHFTVATTRTLPGSHNPRVQECWSIHVPRIALGYEPLLNALIAISALHLIHIASKTSDHIDPGLLSCRTNYLDAALRTHRQMLDQLNPQTADAACFTSGLLLIDAFAMLQDRKLEPYEPPAHWLRIVQGSRYVFQTSFHMVKSDPNSAFMDIIGSASTNMYNPAALFSESNIQNFPHLTQLSSPDMADPDESLDPEISEAYHKTTCCIGSIVSAVEAGECTMALCRRIMTFACFVPRRYLDLVEERRPRALIILANYFSLSAHARDLWWVGDTPEREVYGIRDDVPSSMRHLLDGPLSNLQKWEAQ
ncbi:Sterol uptake control protein 2 [Cytospora mali]|uniref:Sterol uptake control protein 2 n=1 Tax=Cytospora mali TaxID=578113 RepID=A0A194UWK3_CYTMA|nr:Sterol uptake control protein 2 [Valsa mali var. pyri (nom. inval.)]